MTDDSQTQQNQQATANDKQNEESPLDILENVLREAEGAVEAKNKLDHAEKEFKEKKAVEKNQLEEKRQQQELQDQEKIKLQKQKMQQVAGMPAVQARHQQQEAKLKEEAAATSKQEGYEIRQLEHTKIEMPTE